MSETTGVSTQLLVPAYVWQDTQQRNAALVKIGTELAQLGAAMRENIDVANATIHPTGLTAKAAHVRLTPDAEPTTFIGYDLCDVEHADLVMIVCSARTVPS